VKPVLALNMWFLIQFNEARFKFFRSNGYGCHHRYRFVSPAS